MSDFKGTYTPNFHLAKPSGEDKVDISILNANMDIIDDNLGQGGGGSTSQSDYAQNDSTKADYIKNRPCWSEEVTVPYYEFEVDRYGSETVIIGGYAPDLSELVGETVPVEFFNITGEHYSGNGEVVDMGILFPEASGFLGIAVTLEVQEQPYLIGYFISGIDPSTFSHSDTTSVYVAIDGVTGTIRINLPSSQTEYHKLDENYLPDSEYNEYYKEYYVNPTKLENQPTSEYTAEELWEKTFSPCGYVYPTDENHFIYCNTYSQYTIRYTYGQQNDDVVWELSNLDTGNGYTLELGMPLMLNFEWDSELDTRIYFFSGYENEWFAQEGGLDIIPKLPAKYSQFEVTVDSVAELAFDIGYDNQNVPETYKLVHTPVARITPYYSGDLHPSNSSVRYANGYAGEPEYSYITNLPFCMIYPPVNIEYNDDTATLSPVSYYCGHSVGYNKNYKFKYHMHSTIDMTDQTLSIINDLSGAWERGVGYDDWRDKETGNVIDITILDLDYSLIDYWANQIKDDCTSQEVSFYVYNDRFEETPDTDCPTSIQGISLDLGNTVSTSPHSIINVADTYTPFYTKIIIRGKYTK